MNHRQSKRFLAFQILVLTLLSSALAAQTDPAAVNNGTTPRQSAAAADLPSAPSASQDTAPAAQTPAPSAQDTNQKKNPPAKPATNTDNAATEEIDNDRCKDADEDKYTDCRGVFDSSFYIGLAIDTFAGDDMLKYLNPGDSGKIHERAIGGIDFQYRLLGDRMPKPRFRNVPGNSQQIKAGLLCDPSKGEDCENIAWHPTNLWVYGETVHGVRSADVDCTKNKDLPVCGNNPLVIANPEQQFFYMLRNATSLEGFFGFRWEFLGLQQRSSSPANLYLKGQAGFLSMAGTGSNALDVDHIALGAIATKGRYENSYLELGYGRSDMFATARRKRVKVDGYLQRSLKGIKGLSAVSLFVQLLVDTDLGRGSDAIQSFVGLNFDLTKLLSPSNNQDPGKQQSSAAQAGTPQPGQQGGKTGENK